MRQIFVKTFVPALGMVLAMTFAPNSKADLFDQTLASPDNTAANTTTNPSYFNGSGNPQGGWTTDLGNGIELGLRARYRTGAEIDSSTNQYDVLPGNQNAGHALWNYEFSIDLQPGGAGGLTLSQITATLTITDLTTGATAQVNPLTYWGDDSGFGSDPTGANGLTGANKDGHANGADWVAQNSQNPEFGDFPLGNPLVCAPCQAFNPNATDTYEFTLTVNGATGAQLATDTIDVVVTPEPASFILMGTLAAGLLMLSRRRIAAKPTL